MNRSLVLGLSAALLAGFAGSTSAKAAVLAGYDLSGQDGSEVSAPATTVDANVTATDITRGPGFSNPGANIFDQQGIGIYPANSNIYNPTVATATASGQYLLITVTPKYQVVDTFSSLKLASGIQNGNTYNGLSYSINGSTFTEIAPTSTTGGGGFVDPAVGTYDLSSLPADIAGSVTFRLFVLSSHQNPYETGWVGQHLRASVPTPYDVEVDGATRFVPEPASLSVLGLGSLALAARRRRRAI